MIFLPTEDMKEQLEDKIDRFTANNTTSEPKSSKQKDTNKEKQTPHVNLQLKSLLLRFIFY